MLAAGLSLAEHLQGGTTTLAWLWRLQRLDGAVYGFTAHDADITFEGLAYRAAYGFAPSAASQSPGLAVGNAELQATFWADAITEQTLRAGLWDGADVRLRLINWADPSMGALKPMRGWLGEVGFDGFQYSAELRGLQDLLNRPVGRIVSPTCDARLGDARCTVSLAPHTTAGTVLDVVQQRIITTTAIGLAQDVLTTGVFTFTTGANAGLVADVKRNDEAGEIELQLPMEMPIEVGDAFAVVAGCNGAFSTCRDTFNNVVNFRGFPAVPGPDRARRIGGQ
jgi:uncharacterized phage protein (TIGR02218 family)